MKRILRGLLLVLAASAFAQQPALPPYPPGSTPPIFRPDLTPRQQMPSGKNARRLSNAQIEEQIQDKLKSEPVLANTNVSVKSDDKSVQLSGTIDTNQQHDLALRVAQAYVGDRKIVDKIKMRRQA